MIKNCLNCKHFSFKGLLGERGYCMVREVFLDCAYILVPCSFFEEVDCG